ncbi:aromatic ring-hydroxylating dioxygenase subunit alpha [Pseudooceanicola pacificus]|nr:aromatic ring-hydroxylating dioxygenase subunit alpha [Pseudooceanicola pacificus]
MERIFVKRAWYMVAWSDEIAAGDKHRVMVMNAPIVLYRDTAGRLVALEDRCCHRAAPLSIGRIEGDDLRCMYHGLKFDRTGRCIEIPGQDRIPPHACVRSYAVTEGGGWVWIWMDDPASADPDLIPPVRAVDDPAWIFRRGHLDYDANYMLINDNLLDFSHLSYVHENTFGDSPLFALTRPRISKLDRGVRISRWLRDMPMPRTSLKGGSGKTDRWMTYDFLVPGALLMTSGTYPAGTAERCGDQAPDGVDPIEASCTCQLILPITDTTARYFFTNGPSSRTGSAEQAEHAMQLTLRAFDEDKEMIEAQSRTLSLDPYVKMVPVSADAALSMFRWKMNDLMKAEAEQAEPGTEGAVA